MELPGRLSGHIGRDYDRVVGAFAAEHALCGHVSATVDGADLCAVGAVRPAAEMGCQSPVPTEFGAKGRGALAGGLCHCRGCGGCRCGPRGRVPRGVEGEV